MCVYIRKHFGKYRLLKMSPETIMMAVSIKIKERICANLSVVLLSFMITLHKSTDNIQLFLSIHFAIGHVILISINVMILLINFIILLNAFLIIAPFMQYEVWCYFKTYVKLFP